MEFLLDEKDATSTAEWLVAAFLIIAVVGSVIYAIGDATATQGTATEGWVEGVPAPSTP